MGFLLRRLLKKKIPLVIIDTHGEYVSLGKPNHDKKDQKNMEKFGVKANDYAVRLLRFHHLPAGKQRLI